MNDAPETIWATSEWNRIDQGKWWDSNPGGDSEEYHLADLPATNAMDDPRVQALVDLCNELIDMMDWVGTGNWESGQIDQKEYKGKLAALAAMENPDG